MPLRICSYLSLIEQTDCHLSGPAAVRRSKGEDEGFDCWSLQWLL